jgi:hypothetical protein
MDKHLNDLLWLIATLVIGGSIGIGFKMIWEFLSKKGNDNSSAMGSVKKIIEQVMPDDCRKILGKLCDDSRWLKDAHNKCDENGVPLWYVPRELISILRSLKEARAEQKNILEKIAGILQTNQEILMQT